jgi:predicted nucleotidyltransferase component of viral defense system
VFDALYVRQAELMLRCLPEVGKQSCFALKGGTAINLFLRSMPRLSVDIDLTYLPLSSRDESLRGIGAALREIDADIKRHVADTRTALRHAQGTVSGINVATDEAQIKIEANLVLRGTVRAPVQRDLCEAAVDRFEMFVSAQSLSLDDLYGGKICAALDRQHPRDLYDIHVLLQNEGLTAGIRRCFVVYLAGHSRPMHELLDPHYKDLRLVYDEQLLGMVEEDVSLDVLYETRERLVRMLRLDLEESEKRFLLSLKRGDPDWNALDIDHLEELPALQWKLLNIQRMDKGKRTAALAKLETVLQLET